MTREREDRRRPEPGLILLMMRMRLRGSGILGRFIWVGVGWDIRVFMDFVYDIYAVYVFESLFVGEMCPR